MTSGNSTFNPVTSTAPSMVTLAIPTTSTANASPSVRTTTGGSVATFTSIGYSATIVNGVFRMLTSMTSGCDSQAIIVRWVAHPPDTFQTIISNVSLSGSSHLDW